MNGNSLKRRNLIKGTVATAFIGSVGPAAVRPARADDDIKFAQDPASLQPGLEAAHTPLITVEKVEAGQVAYGKTPPGGFYRLTIQARHEATKDHHIFGIALFVNGENRAQFRVSDTRPEATLPLVVAVQRLQPGDQVMAVTQCNLHGKWGSRVVV